MHCASMALPFCFNAFVVSFGGVAGLFLGMSLLSGVEIIYYLTVGLFYQSKRIALSALQRLSGKRQTRKSNPMDNDTWTGAVSDNKLDQSSRRAEMNWNRGLGNMDRNRNQPIFTTFDKPASEDDVIGVRWRTMTGEEYSTEIIGPREWGYHKWAARAAIRK